jgi:hypothetical protein
MVVAAVIKFAAAQIGFKFVKTVCQFIGFHLPQPVFPNAWRIDQPATGWHGVHDGCRGGVDALPGDT